MFRFKSSTSATSAAAPPPGSPGRRLDRAERATFAGGCFWGVEAVFREIEGVTETRVGYTGGGTPDPTYERVCGHTTTTPNRKGWDVGDRYRSASAAWSASWTTPADRFYEAEDYHQQYFEKQGRTACASTLR